jgi:hypothetical protein
MWLTGDSHDAGAPEILGRIEPTGALDRIRTSQQRVLISLLTGPRIAGLVELEALRMKRVWLMLNSSLLRWRCVLRLSC